jgi:hypothetical protein
MAVLVILFFLLAATVTLWAMIFIFASRRLNRLMRVSYVIGTLAIATAAFFTTFYYGYYSDPNTCVFGWPIPMVVEQRTNATSPWLDFAGPTVVLAYPMNFLIFLFLPSILVLVQAGLQKRRV